MQLLHSLQYLHLFLQKGKTPQQLKLYKQQLLRHPVVESAGGDDAAVEEPVEGSGETGTGQTTAEGDTQETAAEIITTETGPMTTDTTELAASGDLTSSEVPGTESTIPVDTEADYSPSISTDKDDYNPGETVIISGEGFIPDGDIHIKIYNTDNIVENEVVINADSDGQVYL